METCTWIHYTTNHATIFSARIWKLPGRQYKQESTQAKTKRIKKTLERKNMVDMLPCGGTSNIAREQAVPNKAGVGSFKIETLAACSMEPKKCVWDANTLFVSRSNNLLTFPSSAISFHGLIFFIISPDPMASQLLEIVHCISLCATMTHQRSVLQMANALPSCSC